MLGLNPWAEGASAPHQQLLWRICQHLAQDFGAQSGSLPAPLDRGVGRGKGKGRSGQELQQDRGRAEMWFVDSTALSRSDPGN